MNFAVVISSQKPAVSWQATEASNQPIRATTSHSRPLTLQDWSSCKASRTTHAENNSRSESSHGPTLFVYKIITQPLFPLSLHFPVLSRCCCMSLASPSVCALASGPVAPPAEVMS